MPDWICQADSEYPTSTQASWSGDAARQRLWEHFGWVGDQARLDDGGDTRRAFMLADADRLGEKAGYRFPFCDVVDGKLQAVRGGLHSAASGLGSATDVVDRERARAREIIEGYFTRLHAPEEDDRGLLLSTLPITSSRMMVQTDSERALQDPTAGLPPKLLEQVHDTDVLRTVPIFLMTASASSDLPDNHGTRMRPNSLRNFSESAARGLPLVNSHRKDMLPIGRIYDGKVTHRGGITRAEFDTYMPMGDYEVGGVRTASVVDGVRLGINRDTSIGFYGGRIICSICERDMPTSFFDILFGDEDKLCMEHMPLSEYDEVNEKGKRTGKRVMCYGDVDDANCAEMSLVFKGSNPDTQVLSGKRTTLTYEEVHTPLMSRAIGLDAAGRLSREDATVLDSRFNLSGRGYRLDALTRRYALPVLERATPTEESEELAVPIAGERAKKKGDPDKPPSDSNVDPDNDGDDDRTPDGDTDHSHWTPDGKKKKGMWGRTMPEPEEHVEESESDPPAGGERAALANALPDAATGGTAEFGNRLRGLLVECRAVDAGFTGDPVAHIRHHFVTELPRLRERADLGEEARSALIEETKAEGIRAFGKDAFPEFYSGIIDAADMPTLRSMKEHFRSQAATRLQGGRGTVEEVNESASTSDADDVPDSAYMAR